MYGIPFGAPSQTVPKSGWRLRSPHDAISVAELGSTADLLMSVFHGLSSGNGRRSSVAPEPGAVPVWSGGVEEPGSLAEEQAASAIVSAIVRWRMLESCLLPDDRRRDSGHAISKLQRFFSARSHGIFIDDHGIRLYIGTIHVPARDFFVRSRACSLPCVSRRCRIRLGASRVPRHVCSACVCRCECRGARMPVAPPR